MALRPSQLYLQVSASVFGAAAHASVVLVLLMQ